MRKYSNVAVKSETLDAILSAGTRAATAGNLQLYTILVLDDRDSLLKLDKVLELLFFERSNCPIAVIALADQYRVRRWLRAHTDCEINNHRPYNYITSIWDALIALQNIIIAAESLELWTCYLGSGVELDIQEPSGALQFSFLPDSYLSAIPIRHPT